MEGDTYGFLAVEDEHASNSSLGDAVPTCALDASDECMKSPDGGTVAWLDEFRDESCRAVQYSNTSAIPRPIRAAFNVCVVKSGLSKAIPDAITQSRKAHVDRFHKIVSSSVTQDIPLDDDETGQGEPESQGFASIVANDATFWEPEEPIHYGYGRSLQQLAAPVPDSPSSFETNLPPSVRLGVSYFESMPFCLLPLVVGLGIAVVLVPLFLLFFCLRNCKCSKRLCSCFCCLRIFFKSTKRCVAEVERWQSNGASTASSDTQYRGSVRKLVPRSSCLGVRYLVLTAAFCTVAAALSVGMYVVVSMGAQLSQLACSAGQAASTIINGQTFAHPSASSLPNVGILPIASPFASPTLFRSAPPAAPTALNGPPSLPSTLQPEAHDSPLGRLPYLGEAIGADPALTRRLQQDDADSNEDEIAPKRTGFLGAVPALAYFRSLLMALDPESENSLARQLRMTTEVAARISRKVAEMKMNLQTLKKTLHRPENSGMEVIGESAEYGEATHHLSPVSVAAPSLLSSWETAIHLLPSTFFAIAESSEQLAAEIEASLQQTNDLLHVKDLQWAKETLGQALDSAQPTVKKIPKLGTPLFWSSIVTLSLMGVLVLLTSLYLCCLCCCHREALVDRKATSCGCSFLLLLVSAAALVASGGLLVGSAMLTDGCLYTESYLKDDKDVDRLLQYFQQLTSVGGSSAERSLQTSSSAAAKVLAACLLPNQERDLVRVFNIDTLVKAGVRMREAGRTAVEKEALAARLLSLQLQDAAAELQLLKETHWLLLIDPMSLEQEDLDERLDTYKEVLCSGVQDKQRELKASYLGLSPASKSAAAAGEEQEVFPPSRLEMFSLLHRGGKQPSDELAALLHQLNADPLAADRLSASFQDAIREMEASSSSSSRNRWERAMKPMIEGVVGELMRLAADKSEAEKTQLLHAVVRLAGQAHAEVHGDREAAGSSSSAAAVERRKRRRHQHEKLLELLQDTCMQTGARTASGGVEPAERLVVYGLEDVEEMVAPFILSSLHSSSSSRREDERLLIDASSDADSAYVLEVAAAKGSVEEQRQFANAIWWAAKKEALRAETNKSFRCPPSKQEEGNEQEENGTPCNWEQLQETTQQLLYKMQKQLDSLWGEELRPFFAGRFRAFGVVGFDFELAAANADCRMVYNEVQPLQELLCEQLVPSGANLALLLLLLGAAALLLLPCFCCLWCAALQNTWAISGKLNKHNNAVNSRQPSERSPPWTPDNPTLTNPPNAAAAAAVAAAAAAAAAAANGVAQPPMQQRYYHLDRSQTVRNEDWS